MVTMPKHLLDKLENKYAVPTAGGRGPIPQNQKGVGRQRVAGRLSVARGTTVSNGRPMAVDSRPMDVGRTLSDGGFTAIGLWLPNQ